MPSIFVNKKTQNNKRTTNYDNKIKDKVSNNTRNVKKKKKWRLHTTKLFFVFFSSFQKPLCLSNIPCKITFKTCGWHLVASFSVTFVYALLLLLISFLSTSQHYPSLVKIALPFKFLVGSEDLKRMHADCVCVYVCVQV